MAKIRGKFFGVDTAGAISLLAQFDDWHGTWHTIVPLSLAGGGVTELLFYDRLRGVGRFFSFANGILSSIREYTNWRKTWDIIVPGDFAGDGNTDLLFYDRAAGDAKFFQLDGQANLTLLNYYTDWRSTWDLIVPGTFSTGGHTDLLFYDRRAGEGKFFKVHSGGQLNLQWHYYGWRKSWDQIVPGNFGGPETTDLLFYDRSAGEAKFFGVDLEGQIHLLMDYTDWRKTWDVIVPGSWGPGGRTHLLLYDRQAGRGEFHRMQNVAEPELLRMYTDWRKTWSLIVPGTFTADVGTDLLFYEHSLNHAAYFGWRGLVDTDMTFSEFFFQDHTLMARFMPQHPVAYAGPVLAENGLGTYVIGQGNYTVGTDGPKLLMQIGSQYQTYAVPGLTAGTWQHLAVVRSANVFKFYLNGTHLTPDLTVDPLDSALPGPRDRLRLGRRTNGQTVDGNEAQFYGFIDDVAVFKQALSAQQIAAIINQPGGRFDPGTVIPAPLAAWTFDPTTLSGADLPPSLLRPVTYGSAPNAGIRPAGNRVLAENRDNAYDSALLPRPIQQVKIHLPFVRGQAWKVLWGNNTTNSSHKGTAAFSWDFVLADSTVNTLAQTANPTGCGQALLAIAGGTMVQADDSGATGIDASNVLRFSMAPDEFASYMHVQTGSVSAQFPGKLPLPPNPSFPVADDQQIAQVGTRNADNCHLHIGLRTFVPNPAQPSQPGGVTIPAAFSEYQVSDDQGQTWRDVYQGVPLQNQWIRRPG